MIIAWAIDQMKCYPSADGQTDVVFMVYWRCSGQQAQNDQTYNGTVYGSVTVTYEAGESFTPYADLTQDQVFGWVWASGVNKDETEAAVATQIETQINPPVVSLPLPWSN
jgi:hypothetical protein